MAIGRTFKESLQKALRGLETGRPGFGLDPRDPDRDARPGSRGDVGAAVALSTADRLLWVRAAFRAGWSTDELHTATAIEPVVPREHARAGRVRAGASGCRCSTGAVLLRRAKELGYSRRADRAGGGAPRPTPWQALRDEHGLQPTYKLVDTCAAEFAAVTPYYYSTWEDEDRARALRPAQDHDPRGGGPNRIGQGIEFDYCCVHAAFAAQEIGCEAGDGQLEPGDGLDRLRHLGRPLLRAAHARGRDEHRPGHLEPSGIIVQFGGQTPLNLASGLKRAGAPLIGTSVESIDRRRGPRAVPGLPREARGCASPRTASPATSARPSTSPGRSATGCSCGRATCWAAARWEIVYDDESLDRGTCRTPSMRHPTSRSWWTSSSRRPSRSTSTRSRTAAPSSSAA